MCMVETDLKNQNPRKESINFGLIILTSTKNAGELIRELKADDRFFLVYSRIARKRLRISTDIKENEGEGDVS